MLNGPCQEADGPCSPRGALEDKLSTGSAFCSVTLRSWFPSRLAGGLKAALLGSRRSREWSGRRNPLWDSIYSHSPQHSVQGGMHEWKDIAMDSGEHKSSHGRQHQARRTLPAGYSTFHFVHSQHPPRALGSHRERNLVPAFKGLVIRFLLPGSSCILSHQMTWIETGKLTSWIKEFIVIVYDKNDLMFKKIVLAFCQVGLLE